MRRRKTIFVTVCALLLFLLLHPQVRQAIADNFSFLQTDWTGGQSSDTAAHPGDQTGWTKYASKDSAVTTAVSGKISLATSSSSFTDTSDTDFAEGTLTNLITTGSGDGTSLTMNDTLDDPFVSDLGQWDGLPDMPTIESYVAYERAGDYIYSFWCSRRFGKFDISTNRWTFIADAPECVGYGCTLAYPGSGDYIYATQGGGAKKFWRYSISGDSWSELADTPVSIRDGACSAIKGDYLYLCRGGDTQVFMRYSISGNSWETLTDTNYNVDYGSYLTYPGSGDYLYLNHASNDGYTTRYDTETDTWVNRTNQPTNLYGLFYPGSGSYMYGWYYANGENRNFCRYNYSANTWENLTDAYLPSYVAQGYIYETGGKLKLVHSRHYTKPLTYDPATERWEDLMGYNYTMNYGSRLVYDGNDYLYAIPGNGVYNRYRRYSISENKWSSFASGPSYCGTHRGGDAVLHNGYIYVLYANNNTRFFRYNTSGNSWEQLASTPATAYYGGAVCGAGDYVYAFRGNNSASFWRYDPATNTWDDGVVADAPANVYYGGCLIYPGSGDYIYGARGYWNNTFWRYSISGNTWEEMASCPFMFYWKGKLDYPGSGNYIYAFTGVYGGVARYDITTDTWEEVPWKPTMGHYGTFAVVGDNIYYAYYTNYDLQCYNITSEQLTNTAYSNTAGYSYGNVAYPGGDIAYLFYSGQHIWKYSVSQKKFTGFITIPEEIYYTKGLFGSSKAHYPGSGNYIYVLAGYGSKSFYAYDYVNDTWTARSDAPVDMLYGNQITGTGDVLYVCQGRDCHCSTSSDQTSYNFMKYTISTDTWEVLADLPERIYSSAFYGDYLVYVSSDNAVYYLPPSQTRLYRYDITAGTWSQKANPSSAHGCLYYPGSGDYIYFYRYDTNYLYRYSTSSNSWSGLGYCSLCSNRGYDISMFTPDGNTLYIWNAYSSPHFGRYDISENMFDNPAMSNSLNISAYTTFVEGSDGNTYYGIGYDRFNRYDITARTWTGLRTTYNDLGWRVDANAPSAVEHDNYIYTTRGYNTTNFARYQINSNRWFELASPPHAFGAGHQVVNAGEYLYVLRGGSTTYFWIYYPTTNEWVELNGIPSAASNGAVMVYPGYGDYIYVGRGAHTPDFYRYTISSNSWEELTDIPVDMGYYGGSMVYPGSGDYLYLIPGQTYNGGSSNLMYKYSMTTNTWTHCDEIPIACYISSELFYPGSGDYLYCWPGQDRYYVYRYKLFKQGDYVSDVKNIGKNKELSTVNWNDTGSGGYELKARTSNDASLGDASAWADISNVIRFSGGDLSTLSPDVANTEKYLQYKMSLYADDLDSLPVLEDITINWDKYPLKSEIISSSYDSGDANNRLMKLNWQETLLAGTDARFQLSTAPDDNGSPGSWSVWLGPGGTQTYSDPYTTESNYSYADSVEITEGVGRLKMVYSDFTYTQRIVLDNSAGSESYANANVLINIDSTNKHFWEHVKSDGSDVRFVDTQGNTLSYCLDTTIYGTSWDYDNETAVIYVNVPSVPAATKTSIYLKYGNASAEGLSTTSLFDLPVTNNLILYYPFEDDEGSTTVADASGEGNTGTLVNDPKLTTGKFRGSLSFDGSNDYIDTDLTIGQTSSDECTFAAWVKCDSDSTNWHMVFDTENGGSDWGIRRNGDNWYLFTGGDYRYCGEVTINEWQHVAATFSRYKTKFYINGEKVQDFDYISFDSSTNPLRIGAYAANSQYHFDGDMDQVLVYDRALTDSEIEQIYEHTPAVSLDHYIATAEENTTCPSLSGWTEREKIEIVNNAGNLNNYQIKLDFDESSEGLWSKCLSTGYDIRFVDEDNLTVLDYYRSSWDYNNQTASFWIEDPSLEASETKTIYLYYGRTDAADVSSFDDVFIKDFGDRGENTSGLSLDGSSSLVIGDADSLDMTDTLSLETVLKHQASTWLPGYAYRQPVTIDNSGGEALSNQNITVTVTYLDGKMNSDYSDLRFVNDDGYILDYSLNEYDGSSAEIYIKVPSIEADSTKTIYMYYGNTQAASSASEPYCAFYDIFAGHSIDTDTYRAYGGTFSQDDMIKIINNNDAWDCSFVTNATYARTVDEELRMRVKFPTTIGASMIGWHDSGTGSNYPDMVYALYFNTTAINIYEDGNNRGAVANALLSDTWYDIRIQLKATGAIYYYKLASSDEWIELYDSNYSSESNLRLGIVHNSSSRYVYSDNWAVISPSALGGSFGSEATQPAIDEKVISKSGAYELKFTTAGLTASLNGSDLVSTPNYTSTTYMPLAMTYDGSSVKLYADGILKNSANYAQTVTTNSNNVVMGTNLKGTLDEIRIWNIARATGSISDEKENCLTGAESGLVCYLDCNENTGTSASDASSSTNNGTLSVDSLWTTDIFEYANAKEKLLYHFDEGSGITAADSSGNNNTLIFTNISWADTDLTGFSTGNAIELNGSTSLATANDSDSLDVTGQISIEAWIKPDTTAGYMLILDKGDDTQQDNARSNYRLLQSGTGIRFSFYNEEEQIHETTGCFSADEIYHVVATFDEDNDTVAMYVNGSLVYIASTETSTMLTNSDDLYMGRLASGNYSYSGIIDEVRIYNRILPAAEVLCHYEHRLYTATEPSIYNVYEPPATSSIGAYVMNNPTIQPIVGTFYDANSYPIQFENIITTPGRTGIKYQISSNGYQWYYYDGEDWTLVTEGYAQSNTAAEVNTNLADFVSVYTSGEFCYRAYLHGDAYAMKTPSLDSVSVTVLTEDTYYTDATGTTPINTLHTDASNDQWFRYKAILYSDGENTPIVDETTIEYINAYITVTSPNGGEEFNVDSDQTITWGSQAISSGNGYVKIEYTADGGNTYETIADDETNDGSYNWTVPDDPSTDVKIRISSKDFPAVSDESDASFSILSLKVTSPNGSEIWEQGQTHNITWDSYGVVPGNILQIEYSEDNGSTYETVVALTPDDGQHEWIVPAITSDQVLIKISSPSNEAIADVSDTVFSIVPQPVITISSPAGGEEWVMGSNHDITWSANSLQFSDTVEISYSTDDFENETSVEIGVSIGTPAGGNNNDDIAGSYSWLIPEDASPTVKVRVKEEDVPAGRDTQSLVSDDSAVFSIIEPNVTITAPTSGNIWVVGDTEDITWASVGGVSDNLVLEYRVGESGEWVEIATAEANDGTYAWSGIPEGAAGDQVYIQLTDSERETVTDISEPMQILSLPLITITDPNGGEEAIIGSEYTITWTSIGQSLEEGGVYYSLIDIYYSTDNGSNWNLIAYHAANTGSYPWSVPDSESSEALIKVAVDIDGDENIIYDLSDANFSIMIPVITITSPNGGEAWYATGAYDITWSTVGTVHDNITIEFYDGSSWSTIATGEANDGTYTWLSVSDVVTSDALIRMTDADRPTVTDTSDAGFTVMAPYITVMVPNGGEEYVIGESAEITWGSAGYEVGAVSDNLTIQYSIDSGSNWIDISTGEANDGSYNWNPIPDTASTHCLVQIFDADRTATTDMSDNQFAIVEPYVRISSPNGGETWPIGTQHDITWTSAGTISDNLTIQYSKDNFETDINEISTGETNDGSYNWTIPDDYSNTVKVRITDADRPTVTDDSDASFTITYPTITISAPNGSELWTVDDVENITWTTIGSVSNNLTLEYSKDNFVSDINEIATGETNDGTYAWPIPDDVSATVRVRITDANRPAVWDKSDASFTILPIPTITITAPVSGDTWRLGTNQTITWEDNGGLISNNLKIEISTGGPWSELITGISNTGSYNWSVPDDSDYVSTAARFKITDASRETTYDESDEFTIAYPLITITSPNGGEYWAVGDEAPVTWTTAGAVSDNLVVSYSTDSGSHYYTAASGETNDGSYTWTVPDAPSSNCLLRIQDGNRPNDVLDVSDASFSILSVPTITITAPNGGEEYVLGDTMDIAWTWRGLSISDNLVLDYALDGDFSDPSKRQIIASSGVENDGSYSWVISADAITGSSLVMRITDYERTLVTDQGDGYFRIRGGFNVTSPAGNESWTAQSEHPITWNTQGGIPRVNLQYSTDNGSNWTTIANGVTNTNSYAWTLPDIQTATAKVRVVDYTDNTVVNESEAFSIVYQTVQFKVMDYDTMQHLNELNVNEPASGWVVSDNSLESPITRTTTYPYDTYTSFFTKEEYIDNSVTWAPPTSGTDTYVVTLYMESTAAAQVSWEAILTYSYSPASDTLTAVGSLQRKGKLVGAAEHELPNLGVASLVIYNPDNTIRTTLSAALPNQTTAMYNFTYADTEFEAGEVYPAILTITYNEQAYSSDNNIDVGSEILQYEFFTETASQLATTTSTIQSSITAQTSAIQSQLTSQTSEISGLITGSEENIKSDTAKILTAAEETIPAAQSATQSTLESFMKSEILNTEGEIRSGDELTIRYRTHSGLAPAIDIYDADNSQVISKGLMREIGTTGIYEYPVEFKSAWGQGDFTIVCSESTKGTLDALNMGVITTDIEALAGDLGAVVGATANLPDLEDITDSLRAQLTVVESSLSSVTQGVTKQLEGELSELENVFEHLSSISEQVKAISSQHNINLDKLYEVSKDKAEDVDYLVNKTQELKAAIELNQKLLEDASNEPVTQTWYEYK